MHWVAPDHLPETSGLVDCFLVNGEGEADGLVLTDGTEVHFPPHLSQAVLAVVRPGAIVRVRGLLLENGRAGRFPPHVAASVAGLVTPGQPTVLRGAGLAARTAPSSRSGDRRLG